MKFVRDGLMKPADPSMSVLDNDFAWQKINKDDPRWRFYAEQSG